jgi:hypothetical protein
MDILERLSVIEDVKRLKADYFFYLDHKDWNRWRDEVFTEDAVMMIEEIQEPSKVGRDAIISYVSSILDGVTTIHHGHMPVIDILDTTHAKGRWAMEDVLFLPRGRIAGRTGRIHGYGYYDETYVKLSVGWRINALRISRLYIGPLGGNPEVGCV